MYNNIFIYNLYREKYIDFLDTYFQNYKISEGI